MMALLALWRAGGLTKYAIMAAVVVGAFLSGLAIGNVHATRRFVAEIQKHDDEQFAKYTNQLAEQVKAEHETFQAHLSADLQKGRKADDRAFATLTKAKDEARHDSSLALTQLAKETHPDVPPSCPAYTWSPDARGVLNRAAGARDPAPDSSVINPITKGSGSVTASGRATDQTPR